MNNELKREIEEFIAENSKENTAEIALQLSKRKHLPTQYILNQINGIQRSTKKFPFLQGIKGYLYPSPISVSQASSEEAARYKASLFTKLEKAVDLSGGMGIDTYFLSRICKQIDYVEQNDTLFQTVSKNFKTLNTDNINLHHTSAEEFISRIEEPCELIYADPDRREGSKRHFRMQDCSPNIMDMQSELLQKSTMVLLKYSPMLDISSAINDLKHVAEVHVLSVQNEVKELLFLLKRDFHSEVKIKAIDLNGKQKTAFEFSREEESESKVVYSNLKAFLYEPNSAILKAGAFQSIAKRYKLDKLAKNTHLYTSNQLMEEFPGRRLEVINSSKKASDLTKKANIVNRNSGLSVEEIKKKYKIKEGGEEFLYAFRNNEGKRLFALAQLKS